MGSNFKNYLSRQTSDIKNEESALNYGGLGLKRFRYQRILYSIILRIQFCINSEKASFQRIDFECQ